MVFAVSGKPGTAQAALLSKVMEHGASVASSVTRKVTHLVSTQEDVDEGSPRVNAALRKKIFIVSEQFVNDSIKKNEKQKEEDYLLKPSGKKKVEERKEEKAAGNCEADEAADDRPASSVEGEVKVKGKAAVDTFSGLADSCHVYVEGDYVYDCMLTHTDIRLNSNKFFVIQLLQLDSGSNCFLWNRWGRIGERGQSKMIQKGNDLAGAKRYFETK
eukprot:TRINITY_DN1033_c0_g1_i1.p1 TRINITY_DN1033_c0_g1~~TRINITY_DN1033_c0_g1_i1.p1  ORF type:complete len:239 (+),score=96.24 TRINITY_DN1033_c0_g1_i1:71-718(+)